MSALCRVSPLPFVSPRRRSSLVQASCLCDSPRCFVPLRVSLFSPSAPDSYFSLLSCSDDVRAGSSGFLLLLLMPLHRIEASLINQLPHGRQQNIFTYGASFGLLAPRLYNPLSNYFYLIWLCRPPSSLSRLVRSAGLSPAAAIDWNISGCLFDETSRSKPQGWTLENVPLRSESFFFLTVLFFFFSNKDAKTSFHLQITAAALLRWYHMNAYVTQHVNGGIVSEILGSSAWSVRWTRRTLYFWIYLVLCYCIFPLHVK